jgi:hypothetical protein
MSIQVDGDAAQMNASGIVGNRVSVEINNGLEATGDDLVTAAMTADANGFHVVVTKGGVEVGELTVV